MQKNVVALLGTARKNNTNTLLENFLRGAKENGNHTQVFPIGDKEIHGCRGCGACYKKSVRCIQADDMQPIYDAFEKADVIVLASPIYFANITAQTKAVIDRLYCYDPPIPKESYLLLTAGGGDGANTNSAISTYETAAQYLAWENKGIILAENVGCVNDVLTHPAYIAAYELGKTI